MALIRIQLRFEYCIHVVVWGDVAKITNFKFEGECSKVPKVFLVTIHPFTITNMFFSEVLCKVPQVPTLVRDTLLCTNLWYSVEILSTKDAINTFLRSEIATILCPNIVNNLLVMWGNKVLYLHSYCGQNMDNLFLRAFPLMSSHSCLVFNSTFSTRLFPVSWSAVCSTFFNRETVCCAAINEKTKLKQEKVWKL